MAIRYSTNADGENMAKAQGRDLAVSTKQSVEICAHIRKMPLEKAIKALEESIDMKKAIPFRRYNDDVGHKKGIGMGRFAVKACKEIKAVLESVRAAAQSKGLGKNLVIIHINAHKASSPRRYGRHRGRQAKRTHIEVVVREMPEKKKDAREKDKKDNRRIPSGKQEKEKNTAETEITGIAEKITQENKDSDSVKGQEEKKAETEKVQEKEERKKSAGKIEEKEEKKAAEEKTEKIDAGEKTKND